MGALDTTSLQATQPSTTATGPNPLVRFVSNTELLQKEKDAADAIQSQPHIKELARHLRKLWEQARFSKQPIQTRMLRSLRQRDGQYDPDVLEKIKSQGGSTVYMMVTNVKCRAAESWIRDIMLPADHADDKPWGLQPSPVVDLPPAMTQQIQQQVQMQYMQQAQAMIMMDGVIQPGELEAMKAQMQSQVGQMLEEAKRMAREQAKEIAENHENYMADQFIEGKFYDALSECIADIVTFPAAIMKGPIVRKKERLVWQQDEFGTLQPVETTEFSVDFERRSPFDIYPSPDASDIQGGYLFDRHDLTLQQLNEMKDCPGYDNAAIDQVIEEYGRNGLKDWLWQDMERAHAEQKTIFNWNQVSTIEALEFWGDIPGYMLVEWGMDPATVPDRRKNYHVNAWMVGRWVIKATINKTPLGRRPYGKAAYEKAPGQFWGRGVPELMVDIQTVCNATARALVGNMALASGPQVAINDINRIPKGEDITNIYPWKIWQFKPDVVGNNSKPVEFFQPSPLTTALLEVLDRFSRLADDVTGIPAYAYGGGDGAGSSFGRTASGLNMYMTHASRGIKHVINNIDNGIIKPVVENTYTHNMLYAEDEAIKGDLRIVAKGSSALLVKESQQVRRNEFLAQTANPIDMQILGIPGRAAILREVAKSLDMDTDDLIPDPQQLEQMQMMQQMMGAPQGVPNVGSQQPKAPGDAGQQPDGAPQSDADNHSLTTNPNFGGNR